VDECASSSDNELSFTGDTQKPSEFQTKII